MSITENGMIRGRFRSRKSMKRALGLRQFGQEGRTYLRVLDVDQHGNRSIKVGLKRYMLSLGALR